METSHELVLRQVLIPMVLLGFYLLFCILSHLAVH